MNRTILLSRLARLLGRARGPGYVDHFDKRRVAGWVFDPEDRESPAMISVHVDGSPELNILADIPRDDVQAAGLGPLRCGFDTSLPRRLRDGRAHRVELRLGADGPIVRGGVLNIPAGDAELSPEEEAPTSNEGVAWLDRRRRSIAGWATGCAEVTLQFDDGVSQQVRLDRPVPGFGSGARQGFRQRIPANLLDGHPHAATVRFGRGGDPLDGAPVQFTLRAEQPIVAVHSLSGPRLTLDIRTAEGGQLDRPAKVLVDGENVPQIKDGHFMVVELPSNARKILVQDGEDENAVLAAFRFSGQTMREIASPDLPKTALSDQAFDAATQAFRDFCDAPDSRFDALWYRAAYPGAVAGDAEDPDAAALSHYQQTGAAQGLSPNAIFDEGAARNLYPALYSAIKAGKLPCAFAMELHLGAGILNASPDLPTDMQTARDGTDSAADDLPAAIPASLPPATHALSSSESIYSAWVSRLEINEKQKLELQRDEQEMRRRIAGLALTRKPLISIIMPSWNRAFTIGEAVQSVLDQSYDNWELIIADDASEDRTAEVVRNFDDPRIRYMKFLKSNGAGARNKGLRFARGEYIAYLDSDNIWHPQFLDLMIRQLLANPGSAIAYSAYLDTEIDGARVLLHGISRPSFRPVPLSSKNFMDLNTIVHHRRLYDWMGGFDNDLPRLQDWDLALRYTSVFRPLFVNRIGVFYRRNVAWGQVTHLHMASGAQGTVNEKTQARLNERHERLSISWPVRGRLTVLAASAGLGPAGVAARVEGESLARLASETADVDLVVLGQEGVSVSAENVPGVTQHAISGALCRDPLRLSAALGPLLSGRPVFATGVSTADLKRLPDVDPGQVWILQQSGIGSRLVSGASRRVSFDLGALPVSLPPVDDGAATPCALVLLPGHAYVPDAKVIDQIAVESQRRNLRALIAPAQADGQWQIADKGRVTPVEGDMPAELGRCVMTLCFGTLGQVSAHGFALLNALQARGVPVAVPADADKSGDEGFAAQWIAARAAYKVAKTDPAWVFEKSRKLIADKASYDRMSDRSRKVHRIALHPQLAQERMNYALYRLLFDLPQQEVIDARS